MLISLTEPLIPQNMITYPISRGRFVNIVAFEFHPQEEGTHFDGPWVADEDPSYVQGLFQGWEKEVGDITQVSPLSLKGASCTSKFLMILLLVFGWIEDDSLGY